jgi:hypothetical protein
VLPYPCQHLIVGLLSGIFYYRSSLPNGIVIVLKIVDFIKICFDFRTAFCVSAKFGSYAARNMFP